MRVAFITADSIALESGLAAGETVVTDGALFLENGEAVEVAARRHQAGGESRRPRARKVRRGSAGSVAWRCSNFRSAATSSRWWRSCAWSRSAGTRSTSVPREEDPYFKIPGFTIAAIYPGADPEGSGAAGRQAASRTASRRSTTCMKMETSIRDGVSFTAIEFETFADADKKYDEVTREMNALRPEFPPETQIIMRQVLARAW